MNQGFAAKKYQPILEIGSGGMSRVYLTVVRGPGGFNKFQVVKRLLPSLAGDPEFLSMFLEEARLSARLNHANVVQINEVGFDGKHHLMAMEYLEGQSLESVVRRATRQGKSLPLHLHLRVLAEAAAGLHYAHEFADLDGRPLNIVHRDVSPHNVFVTYQGQVKVLDFGIAKAADSAQHTRTGMLKGKVAYMAPEQLRRSEAVDRRADVFALGVMLWQAVAGRRLWQNMSDLEVFQQLNTRQLPSLREAKPDAPEALVRICEQALSFDVGARQATAAEFADAIEAYLASGGHRASGRELGAFVSNLFASKRAEVQALVEAALNRRPESLNPPAQLASLSQRPDSLMPPQIVTGLEEGYGGEIVRSTSQPLDPALLSLSGAPLHAFETRGGPPPRRGRWIWAAAATALGAAAVAFFALRSPGRPADAAPVALAPGVDSAAPPEAPSA
ncbi:MAG TPA: serine/threonine-protein kinase, partial [Polyangiaceae bacterium]|nr:serine/threonine-protein kinase [Polyangiaceae bacterium]